MTVVVSKEVNEALASGAPIVALETAVLTAGLPRTLWNDSFGPRPMTISGDQPINIALADAMNSAVVSNGAVPAWIAVVDGVLRIGLSHEERAALSNDQDAGKVSLATFAQTMQDGRSAGTTVAATLLACKLASEKNPIRVFATGGIGGIHQNWAQRFDISADLTALATTPTCVVASGAKSILDIPATVEALETIGVPVIGIGTSQFPRFIEKNAKEDPTIYQGESAEKVASICRHHWEHLALNSAVLTSAPVPDDVALEQGTLIDALTKAEAKWAALHQPSATRTPYLLDAMAKITQGASLVANLALLCNNAKVAANISVALATNV
ncbi:MAG: pseudouridine-5-phosphate glycosidase [Phycisphaerae bacterium]|nr:pseudouridine-5-phosphate glycosidase [Phycisphaerae bacterium]